MKIGSAFDIHPLVEGRKLILGGVEIAYERGLLGHSDADIVLHALAEALIGAMGLGGLGQHFPSNAENKDISSVKIITYVAEIMKKTGYQLVNADISILIERPRLSPFLNVIKDNIASMLNVNSDIINVKCGTNEGFDSIGKEESAACFATVLID